ncbi:MAG: putative membrane protein [Candidatus Methanomarinus sp.]|nr:MAG: putative membrane protein [ANME-2 cluster archaeon]
MELYELLRINSLEKNTFLKFILAIQFTILFIIGLDAIGLNIPILRQLIGFIYLTFVPGILIFRILKIHGFDLVNTLLFTVGLSITFIMLCGLFINALYPIIGIPNPLSTLSLTATTCVFILIFSIIIYYRDEDIIETNINQKHVFKPSILLPIIILLPALSVF